MTWHLKKYEIKNIFQVYYYLHVLNIAIQFIIRKNL